jgi:Rrf2 family transcriptional regulator, iron-sulfur cluster assembly transcription factor
MRLSLVEIADYFQIELLQIPSLAMITTTSEYAIRAVGFLAVYGRDRMYTSGEISKATGIPQRFLQKILNELKKDGIINTVRGKTGGFSLNTDPDDISLHSVISCFEDLKRHSHCPLGDRDCGTEKESNCPMHSEWNSTLTNYMKFLKETKFGSFSEDNLPFGPDEKK